MYITEKKGHKSALVRNMSFLCFIQERLFQSSFIVSQKLLMLRIYSRYSDDCRRRQKSGTEY